MQLDTKTASATEDVAGPLPVPRSYERMLIAARVLCCQRTVDNAYRGRPTHATTRARIREAAAKLGFAPPPEAQPTAPAKGV